MVERKEINLVYEYDENWIGGTYYILNIIKALNVLKDELKPQLVILYNNGNSLNEIKQIKYPYIYFVSYNSNLGLVARGVNLLSRFFINKSVVKVNLNKGKIIDYLYPMKMLYSCRNIKKSFFWIPDLQEHFLPQFFKRKISGKDIKIN